jgi:chorismate mutase/prephenate dehydratase
MDLSGYRTQLDNIDTELVKLFSQRMDIAKKVAAYKAETGTPVFDHGREREILTRVTDNLPEELQTYGGILYSTLFDLSRSYQMSMLRKGTPLEKEIGEAMAKTRVFPAKATVACQGIEGAYSQQAVDRLFPLPDILYFQRFEGVFQAVEKGLCKYGVLPIENSLYGSVTEV